MTSALFVMPDLIRHPAIFAIPASEAHRKPDFGQAGMTLDLSSRMNMRDLE